jgi:hypothetical protein
LLSAARGREDVQGVVLPQSRILPLEMHHVFAVQEDLAASHVFHEIIPVLITDAIKRLAHGAGFAREFIGPGLGSQIHVEFHRHVRHGLIVHEVN